MVTRRSYLDFEVRGTQQARGNVISLADALEKQKRSAAQLSPVLQTTRVGTEALGAVSQSASAKITSLTNQIGPLGAGLGAVARLAPQAATGVLAMAVASERASLTSRVLNTTIIGGTSLMLAGGVAAAAYADDIIRAGDSYATLQARIRTYTQGAVQAAQVERELYENARDARQSIDGQVTLYSRLAPAVQDYGKTQQDALRITELATKALAIQGATVRENEAATVQFSQAIASGVLRGDELRSLLESSPQLLRYVAQNLEINGKVGVAFSQLRNLGEKGALTTDKIIASLLRAGPKIEADFINAPKTAQQGWIILSDTITRTVGSITQATGAQNAVVEWLGDLADSADAFRQKMVLDPSSLKPIQEAASFIGGAVQGIGTLGGVAVENFDLIVRAGQAIIALKLGEVFATWFATAARGAQTAIGNLQAFQQAARFQVGASLSPAAATAAQNLRGSQSALTARALELEAQAEVKLAHATAARTAADRAAVQAALAKRSVGAGSAAAAAAEAEATALAAVATRTKEQADKAAAAAQAAKTQATIRATIATEAEAVVNSQVTRGMLAKNVALKAATGLYTLLGGATGIATLAIGGLIYAVWRAEQAYKAQVEAQRDAMVVSDDLRRINDQITASTWAQIPALQAQAQALREAALAARQKAEADLRVKQQELQRRTQAAPGRVLNPEFVEGAAPSNAMTERHIRDLRANVAAAQRDKLVSDQEAFREKLLASTVEASEIQRQLSSGKDPAGRALDAAGKASLEARRRELFAFGQQQVDLYQAEVDRQEGKLQGLKGQAHKNQAAAVSMFRSGFEAAAELVATSDTPAAVTPPSADGKDKKIRTPGLVTGALQELERQQFLPKDGLKRFTVKNGDVIDSTTGGAFKARSEDEAKAGQVYLDTIKQINAATDAQIKKTDQSREALREAASARLAAALETSKAARADERWGDIQEEMTGQSRAAVKAQTEVNRLIADGAALTQQQAQAYVDYVKAREAARRAQDGLQTAQPFARDQLDLALAGLVAPVDARGVVDVQAATKQIMDARSAVVLAATADLQQRLKQAYDNGLLTQQDYERQVAEGTGAMRLAVELDVQDRLLQLRRDGADQQRQVFEDQMMEGVDAVTGALRDLLQADSLSDITDIGASLANERLGAVYEELIISPFRKAIVDLLRATFTPTGAGGQGFWAQAAGAVLGAIGGRPAAAAPRSASVQVSGAGGFTPGFLPRKDGGPVGIVRGPGGPREDKILTRLSAGEFVMNEPATRRYYPMLEMMNRGLVDIPGFANGGMVSESDRPTIIQPTGGGQVVSRQGDITINNYTDSKVETSRDSSGGTRIDIWRDVGEKMIKSGQKAGLIQPPRKPPTRRR